MLPPDHPAALIDGGCVLYKEGRYAEALAKFEEAAAVFGARVRGVCDAPGWLCYGRTTGTSLRAPLWALRALDERN
jgi:hypothetical protein